MRADIFLLGLKEKNARLCKTLLLYYLTIPHFEPKVKPCIFAYKGVLNIEEVILWKKSV